MDWRVTSPTWCPPPPLKKALKRETSRTSLVTRFMEEMSVFLFTLVFHLGGRWHFSFSHRRYKIFMFFFQLNWS